MELREVKIKGFDGLFEINENGTVVYYKGKLLNPFLSKKKEQRRGFLKIVINKKQLYVHRIVALAFVPNPNNYDRVMHLNSNTLDNHYKNLKWGTMKQVFQISVENGLKVGKGNNKPWKLTQRDSNSRYKSSISYEQALKIARRLDNGEHANKICVEYGVSEMSIGRIRRRYCKKKQVNKRYSQETKDKALELIKNGNPPHYTAKLMGISYRTVCRWFKKTQKL